MFKDLQRFPFLDKDLYLHKVFHEHTHLEHINKHGCVNHIKIIVELYNSNNIFLNLINLLLGKSVKLIINVSINFSNKNQELIQQYSNIFLDTLTEKRIETFHRGAIPAL